MTVSIASETCPGRLYILELVTVLVDCSFYEKMFSFLSVHFLLVIFVCLSIIELGL